MTDTTITGTDVVNKQAEPLAAANMSFNEHNVVRSLMTSTVTEVDEFVVTDEKIFHEVAAQSAKKKTFGVYSTKQIVADITPETPPGAIDIVETTAPDVLLSLENKTGIEIVSDTDYAAAVEVALSKATSHIAESLDMVELFELSPSFSRSQVIPGGDLHSGISPMTGRDASIPDYLLKQPPVSTDWDTLVMQDKGGVPKYAYPTTKGPVNITSDGTIRSYVPDTMDMADYRKAQSLISGNLAGESTCTELDSALSFDVDITDKDTYVVDVKRMFKLGLDSEIINCFTSTISGLDITDKADMLNSMISDGDISSTAKLLNCVSPSVMSSPLRTIDDLANNHSAKATVLGSITNRLTDVVESGIMDTLLVSAGLAKADLFDVGSTKTNGNRSVADDIPVVDIIAVKASNPTNGYTRYALGDYMAELLGALP